MPQEQKPSVRITEIQRNGEGVTPRWRALEQYLDEQWQKEQEDAKVRRDLGIAQSLQAIRDNVALVETEENKVIWTQGHLQEFLDWVKTPEAKGVNFSDFIRLKIGAEMFVNQYGETMKKLAE